MFNVASKHVHWPFDNQHFHKLLTLNYNPFQFLKFLDLIVKSLRFQHWTKSYFNITWKKVIVMKVWLKFIVFWNISVGNDSREADATGRESGEVAHTQNHTQVRARRRLRTQIIKLLRTWNIVDTPESGFVLKWGVIWSYFVLER